MPWLIAYALLACARSEAEAWAAAANPDLPLAFALERCRGTGTDADACSTEVLRARPESTVEDCAAVREPRWRAECAFAVADRHAKAGDRAAALAACGEAGRYYQECLYHAWTYDMQGAVHGGGRAQDELPRGREVVGYWAQLQTLGGDPLERMWLDWWYFALDANRPADLADCAGLAPDDARWCTAGTLQFVEREIAQTLKDNPGNAQRRSRVCRGGLADIAALWPDLYRASELLDARAVAGRDRGCAAVEGLDVGRPWNPILLEHRTWSAG